MNIANATVAGSCTLKCVLRCTYEDTPSVLTNEGILLSLTYLSTQDAPVQYNKDKYTVSSIQLSYPSRHLFEGKPADAELLLLHTPLLGGPTLTMAFPVALNATQTSVVVSEIIDTAAQLTPARNDTTQVSMVSWSSLPITKQPFYTYTDPSTTWIVFGILHALSISTADMTTLQHMVQPYTVVLPTYSLYLNREGANSNAGRDGIYIDCSPVQESEETVAITTSKTATKHTRHPDLLLYVVYVLFVLALYIGVRTWIARMNT